MNDRLLQLRKILNLSQDKFGDKLGVTRSSISNMETGRFGVTDTMVKLICSTYNVNEGWFRNGEGEMFNLDEDEELAFLMGGLFSEDIAFRKKLVKAVLKLTVTQLQYFEEFAKLLVEEED